MQNPTILRRVKIAAFFLLLFVFIGYMIFYLLTPSDTCFDNKKNQKEQEVDCGGPCTPCKINYVGKDLVIMEKAFVPGGNNTYDAVVKISNPNDSIGAASFHYVVTLKDEAGAVLSLREGDSYVLPADLKYITQLGLNLSNGVGVRPTQLDFLITNVEWRQLRAAEKPQLSIYNRKFGPAASGIGSEAEGLIRNESSNDFKKIDIVVILRDEKGSIVGVNTTQKDNVRSKEERDFILTWPYAFPAAVRSMEVDGQTNIFDEQNFAASISR